MAFVNCNVFRPVSQANKLFRQIKYKLNMLLERVQMNKILALIFTLLSLTVSATENITINYSWTAADQAANYWRGLAEAANRDQKKYNFIVDYKPGAGGAVAAHHILNTPNSIQATSSAFYIRASLYPTESYDLDKYQSLMSLCLAPFTISSTKYKSWAEVPTDKYLSIGISGLGTTTHLTALQIQKKYPLMAIIPFKSTSEAVMSTLSGQTDFAVNFMGDSMPYKEDGAMYKKSNILGVSGTRMINGNQLLINQGFPKVLAKFGSAAQAVVPKTMPAQQFNEIRQILNKAASAKEVLKAAGEDYCYPEPELNSMEPDKFYNFSRDLWKSMSNGVKVN
jgi:tripartite-type tricarboxylate transporter receptor subunit TctC